MKHLLLFFALVSVGYGQFSYSTHSDTVRIKRDSNVTPYTAGDVIRSSTAAYYPISVSRISATGPSRGYITSVQVVADTPNVTGATFIVRFFNFWNKDTTGAYLGTLTDTTGLNVLTALDNAAYQDNFLRSRFWVGDAAVTLSVSGAGSTAANGATAAMGHSTNLNIPYDVTKGRLWVMLIAQGTYTPDNGGTFRIKVTVERTY